jgi:hypothetical protein
MCQGSDQNFVHPAHITFPSPPQKGMVSFYSNTDNVSRQLHNFRIPIILINPSTSKL